MQKSKFFGNLPGKDRIILDPDPRPPDFKPD